MDLELRDLRYFSAIAQLGHVRRAAERVHRSQPALTKSIRRLEMAFGTPLFHRVGRGIRLTPAGELLLARGSRLQTVSEDLVREIRDFAQGVGDTFVSERHPWGRTTCCRTRAACCSSALQT